MEPRLQAIDAAGGRGLSVASVGDAVRDLLPMKHGERPARVVMDPQHKGVEDLNTLHRVKQAAFFAQLGVDDLMGVRQPGDQ